VKRQESPLFQDGEYIKTYRLTDGGQSKISDAKSKIVWRVDCGWFNSGDHRI